MNDLLDDDFGYEKDKKATVKKELGEHLVPHLYIRSIELEEVVLLLEENDVLFETQHGSLFDSTGLIPLTGNQLDNIKTTFFIQEIDIPKVDALLLEYHRKKEEEGLLQKPDSMMQQLIFMACVAAIIGLIFIKQYLRSLH